MKGTRLPSDWQPSESLRIWAIGRRADLNITEQIEWFKDFWAAKTGQNATKLDWDATFRNWIRAARPTYWNNDKPRHKTPEATRHETQAIRREKVTNAPQQAADLFRSLGIVK